MTKPTPVILRPLTIEDCPAISQAFALQGWQKPTQQYLDYLHEVSEGRRDVIVAEVNGEFAGYLTIVWESGYPPFREAGIPEIVDFNVLKKFQRRGIGTLLMDAAERKIAGRSPIAGIGVGLTPDYGAAQILYIKRGYIPDGRGVFSHGRFVTYGDTIPVDDDFTLCLTKTLPIT
jgi:GNAT superfamily N-acetyltransferase